MKDETIKYLEEQKISEFKFENINKLELTHELMEDIGNLDKHLRDDIIYPCLARLLHDNHLAKDELVKIAEELISDNYLTFDMDNKIKYSTLKRSFTGLQLVILIYVHNRDGIFEEKFVKKIFRSIIEYYKNEKDLRGYEKKVGFIHSIAHSADMFAQLVKCKELDSTDFESMLEAIIDKFKIDSYTYVSDEDERTVSAIFNLLERDILSKEFLISWLNRLGEYERPKIYPEVYRINSNIKHILRSLYFRLLNNEKYVYLVDEIKKVLEDKVKLR